MSNRNVIQELTREVGELNAMSNLQVHLAIIKRSKSNPITLPFATVFPVPDVEIQTYDAQLVSKDLTPRADGNMGTVTSMLASPFTPYLLQYSDTPGAIAGRAEKPTWPTPPGWIDRTTSGFHSRTLRPCSTGLNQPFRA